jgi:hypothetical protein
VRSSIAAGSRPAFWYPGAESVSLLEVQSPSSIGEALRVHIMPDMIVIAGTQKRTSAKQGATRWTGMR